ncbi:MAG: pyruvate, phosphate dikinase, partial [Nitrospirota bacterium]
MKETSSKALEVNIAEYRVEVTVDPKYHVISNVMSRYGGLQKPLNTFLEELCHPRKNWQFIVEKARAFSLGYFYDLKTHPEGSEAVRLYVEIAVEAIKNARDPEDKTGAFSNLYLLLQKFIKESGPELNRFLPVITSGFREINRLPDDLFPLAARSYYKLNRLAEAFLAEAPAETDFRDLYDLLTNYFKYTYSYWLSEKDPREWFEN